MYTTDAVRPLQLYVIIHFFGRDCRHGNHASVPLRVTFMITFFVVLNFLITTSNPSLEEILREWNLSRKSRNYSEITHTSGAIGGAAPIETSTCYWRPAGTLKKVQRNGRESVYATNKNYCFHVERQQDSDSFSFKEMLLQRDVAAEPRLGVRYLIYPIPIEFWAGGNDIRDVLAAKQTKINEIVETENGRIMVRFETDGSFQDNPEHYPTWKEAKLILMGTPPYLPEYFSYKTEAEEVEQINEYSSNDKSFRLARKEISVIDNTTGEKLRDESRFSYDAPSVEDADFYLSKYGFSEPIIPGAESSWVNRTVLLITIGIVMYILAILIKKRRSK